MIINLTKFHVTMEYRTKDGDLETVELPPADVLPTVPCEDLISRMIDHEGAGPFPVYMKWYGGTENLPPHKLGTCLIVDELIAAANSSRYDLLTIPREALPKNTTNITTCVIRHFMMNR